MSLPLFRDLNVLSSQVVVLSLESLSLSIFYESLHVVLSKCVEDIECIRAVWLTTFWQKVWKEFHQVRILLHNWEDALHRQLIILRDIDLFYMLEFEKFFLISEDKLQEVLVEHGIRWDVKLHCKKHKLTTSVTYSSHSDSV